MKIKTIFVGTELYKIFNNRKAMNENECGFNDWSIAFNSEGVTEYLAEQTKGLDVVSVQTTAVTTGNNPPQTAILFTVLYN